MPVDDDSRHDPPGRLTVTRTRLAAFLAALTLCGLAFTAATAAAADTPKYRLTLSAYRGEQSYLEEGDVSDHCKASTTARSTVAFETRAGRPLNVALIRNPINDTIWGQVGSNLQPLTEIYRYWKFRAHYMPETEECSPCGPLSEYGQCSGETFDDRGSDDCGSTEGEVRRGFLTLFVSDKGIFVSAYPRAAFGSCPEPRQDGLPLGSADPKLERFVIPDGTRQLLRMKVGSSRVIRRTIRRGQCGKLSGRGLRVCVETRVHIRATRFA